jgi:hypothetical protein
LLEGFELGNLKEAQMSVVLTRDLIKYVIKPCEPTFMPLIFALQEARHKNGVFVDTNSYGHDTRFYMYYSEGLALQQEDGSFVFMLTKTGYEANVKTIEAAQRLSRDFFNSEQILDHKFKLIGHLVELEAIKCGQESCQLPSQESVQNSEEGN